MSGDWRAEIPKLDIVAALTQQQVRRLVDLMGQSRTAEDIADTVGCGAHIVAEVRAWRVRQRQSARRRLKRDERNAAASLEPKEAPAPKAEPERVTDASRNYERKGEGGEGRQFRDTACITDDGSLLDALLDAYGPRTAAADVATFRPSQRRVHCIRFGGIWSDAA